VEHDGPLLSCARAALRRRNLSQPDLEPLQHPIHPVLAGSTLETEVITSSLALEPSRVDAVETPLDLGLDASDEDDVAVDLLGWGGRAGQERRMGDVGVVEEGGVLKDETDGNKPLEEEKGRCVQVQVQGRRRTGQLMNSSAIMGGRPRLKQSCRSSYREREAGVDVS
jgi:hypothetical protein